MIPRIKLYSTDGEYAGVWDIIDREKGWEVGNWEHLRAGLKTYAKVLKQKSLTTYHNKW